MLFKYYPACVARAVLSNVEEVVTGSTNHKMSLLFFNSVNGRISRLAESVIRICKIIEVSVKQ